MTASEMIQLLSLLPPDTEVLVASDGEGNSYHYAEDLSIENVFVADQYGWIELGYAELTDDLRQRGYTEEDLLPDGAPCVVIWPN